MTLVVYTDASFRGRNKKAGLATIIKVVGGPVLSRSSMAVSALDSNDAECQAAAFGLSLVEQLLQRPDQTMREVVLVSDSDSLVIKINKPKPPTTGAMKPVSEAVLRVRALVECFRAEHRGEKSDPEMQNVDYMSKHMLVLS